MRLLAKIFLVSLVLQAQAQAASVKLLDNEKAEVDCTIKKMLDGQTLAIIGRPYEVNINERTTIFKEQDDLKNIQVEVLVSSEESPFRFQLRMTDKNNGENFESKFNDGQSRIDATLTQEGSNQFQPLRYQISCGN